MKIKNKGRKIYKTKEKNYYGKSPGAKFLSGLLTTVLIGGLGFIGYSVAEPLLDLTKEVGDSQEDVPVQEITTGKNAETTLPGQEDAQESTLAIQNGENAADVPGGNAEPDKDELLETIPGLSSGKVVEQKNFEQFTAYSLTASDLASVETLSAALGNIPADIKPEYIEVPVKVSGGGVYFGCSAYEAQNGGVIQSYILPGEISQTISSYGFKSAALISTFSDNILPLTFPGTGYINDDGSLWLDDSDEYGGKPWVSPYSQATLDYVKYIVDEIAVSGFDCVVCSDFVFPDSGYLPELSGRGMTMAAAANLFADRVTMRKERYLLEVNAADVLTDKAEVLQPMILSTNNIVLTIDLYEISQGISDGTTTYDFPGSPAENCRLMMDLIHDKLSGYNVIVRVKGGTYAELLRAKDEMIEYGYTSYVLG